MKYLQVGTTTANSHVAREAAVVILIVEVLIITSVLFAITEIIAQPSLAADVKVSTESKGSLLGDSEIFLWLVIHFISASYTYNVSSREAM